MRQKKKAEDIVSLNMKGISDMTDYFVVCHGNNERQVQSIARAVKEAHMNKLLMLNVWKDIKVPDGF